MALDSYAVIAGKVVARCPVAGILLARDWVSEGFRRISERRRWTYLSRYGQWLFPAVYNTGTADVTHNSTTVTGTLTVWTAAMVGRQFRTANNSPIYTIATRVSDTEITLDVAYGGATATGSAYEIFRAYQTAPSDFNSFITAVDPLRNRRLWPNYFTQTDLDHRDAWRVFASSNPYAIVFRDMDTSSPPLPRYEIWPHLKQQYAIPFLYETRATDLEDSGATLPRYIRGDVLLEFALWQAALWPGPEGRKNPYFNMGLADRHRGEFERMVAELERQDDEKWEQDVTYSEWWSYPQVGAPYPLDSAYIQSHAVGIGW